MFTGRSAKGPVRGSNGPVESRLAHKSLNSICGLLFKFQGLAYASEGLCVTHCRCICVQRPVLGNRRDLDTNKRGNVCHPAPARNFWTLHTLSGALSSSHQNNGLVFRRSTCLQTGHQQVLLNSSLFLFEPSLQIYQICSWHSVTLVQSWNRPPEETEEFVSWRCSFPRVINIPPGGYVVDLMGAQLRGRVLRRERFGAEPCMKPRYCLELPALPERRGQLLFTRSHTQHFTPFIKCAWVSSSLCACVFCGVFKLWNGDKGAAIFKTCTSA